MILRPALLEDAHTLAELGRSSFCAAFAHLYSAADLAAVASYVEGLHAAQSGTRTAAP